MTYHVDCFQLKIWRQLNFFNTYIMMNYFWSWHTELVNSCVSFKVFSAPQRPDVTTHEWNSFLLKSRFTCLGTSDHKDCYQYLCISFFAPYSFTQKAVMPGVSCWCVYGEVNSNITFRLCLLVLQPFALPLTAQIAHDHITTCHQPRNHTGN